MSTSLWLGGLNSNNWATAGNWSPAGIPGASTDVLIDGGSPVATASIGTVHSITNINADLYFESAGTNTVTTSLTNTGGDLLVDYNGGEGGTSLNIKGTLTNTGALYIGNTTLSASDKVTTALLVNTNTISLTGSTTKQALLDVTGSAGFGSAGLLTGYVYLTGDSAIEFGSGQITSLASGAQLHLTGNDAFIEDSTKPGSNSALAGLASNAGEVQLENKVAVSTTGPLANSGQVYLDYDGGDGGSSLKVAGALSNTGTLDLGNTSLSSKDSITASSLVNSGTINLTGSTSTSTQALLDVTAGAAGFGVLPATLSGYVTLVGDSAVEFASGQITRIAAGSQLQLNGNKAFIEDSATLGSNSALKGLNDVAGNLEMYGDVSVTTTGGLLDTGGIYLDYNGGTGGSTLSLGGAISNSGTLWIGNSSLSASSKVTTTALNNTNAIELYGAGSNKALLDVTGGVAGFGVGGVLTGYVSLIGNTAIEFVSGNIGTIATGATLYLSGNNAYVEDSTALGSNSALNLSNVSGALELYNGASVSVAATTGNPTGALLTSGYLYVDISGAGSSSLKVAGRLTNLGTFDLGNASLTATDQATVAGLANTGTINVTGSSVDQAKIDVTGGVAGFGTAGIATGTVSLSGDSAIEFASGQITTVGLGAYLRLDDNNAVIEDSATLGSNSALHGLSNIVGTFSLDNDGLVSTTGTLTNNGLLQLDAYDYGSGLSTLSVATGLTNNGTLDIGNSGLSGSDKLTAETLSNTGTINLTGAVTTNQALLHVTTGAAGFGTAGTLTGAVDLTNDFAIEFASGQISTIGAASQLLLNGNNAYVEDGASGSNSALIGLAKVVGSLYLANGAKVSATGTGPLADSGLLSIDDYAYGEGGSTLSITNGLTNTGTLDIGNSGLSSSNSVTAASFVNSGTVDLTGAGTNFAALKVSGATTNNGGISINSDSETLAGAVSGAGSFSLSTANLGFNSTVSAGQTINETGLDGLTLNLAQDFLGTINGFGNSGNADTIDAKNFVETGTSLNFVENAADTGGTLTLTDTSLSLTAHILMTGLYSKSNFSLGHDSGTGSLVTFT